MTECQSAVKIGGLSSDHAGISVLYWLSPAGATMIMAVLAIVTGLSMVIWPGRRVAQIEARVLAGDDRFHEEQRSYAAYPWLRSVSATRRWGWVLVVAGIGAIVLRALR